MLILGITGGSGSGKTTLLLEAKARGALVLDCDKIYHELLKTSAELLREIDAQFPGCVENGVLARRKLGKLVFASPDALDALNAITHPYVEAEVRRRLVAQNGATFPVIDAIGLIESGLASLCTATVAVLAPLEQRISRLMERDGIDRAYAAARIGAQKPDAYYCAHCTYTIMNDYPSLEAFTAAVREVLDQFLNKGDHSNVRC